MTDTDPDMMAAEFAMGLLEGTERSTAMRRSLSDPQFALEVEWWRHRFHAMLDEYSLVAAPALQIDRIIPSPVVERSGFRWAFVPLAGIIAASAALLLTQPKVTVEPPAVAKPQQIMLTVLVPADKNGAPFAASIDLNSSEVRVVPVDLAPVGKDAQLWIIRDGVPHSIGLLERAGATRLALPTTERAALKADEVLAVSIEPPGGSLKPIPTGPVVASGSLART